MWGPSFLLEGATSTILQSFLPSTPNPHLLLLGHTRKVFDVKMLLLALPHLILNMQFCQLYYATSGWDRYCGLHISLVFLPQCVMGMSFASNMSIGGLKDISDRLTFLDTIFRVLSNIALGGDKNVMM